MKIKIEKKELTLFLVWTILVVGLLYFGRGVFVTVKQDDYNDAEAHLYETDLTEKKVSQSFSIKDSVEKISFLVKNESGSTQTYSFALYDADTSEFVMELHTEVAYKDDAEQLVEWTIGKSVNLPQNAILEVEKIEDAEYVYICVQNKSFNNVYMEDEIVRKAHIRMAIVYDMEYNIPFLMICAVFFITIGAIFTISEVRQIKIEKLFLFVAVCSGMLFVFTMPFGQEPDGWVHFMRSMDVSEGNFLLPFWDNNANSSIMLMPENINDVNFHKIDPNTGAGTTYMNNIKQLYFSETLVEMEGLGGFCSLFYLPQAIGIMIARLLGLSAYGYMVLGRVFNLGAYVILAYFGLKKMPIFKNVYMVVALLPMMIAQAASFSYDAVLCGLCFLFTGLCFSYAYEKERLIWKNVIALGMILALLLLCKYVYVCIGVLVFLIPMKKFGAVKEYWKAFGIALIPFVAMLGYMGIGALLPQASQTVAEVTEVAQVTTLDFVLANPVFAIKAFVNTLLMYTTYYVEQLNTLGWLNYELGILQFFIPIFMVVVAVLDTQYNKAKMLVKDKILCFIAFASAVSAGLIGLYLMDSAANPIGAPTIQGYQGRYAIPVLMLLLISISSNQVENKIKDFSYKVVGIMAFALSYSAIMVFNQCY